MTILKTHLFVTPPGINKGVALHVDYPNLGQCVPKLNWAHPDGELVWYQPNRSNLNNKLHLTQLGEDYLKVDPTDAVELARYRVPNKTTLIDAGIPHCLEYNGTSARISLSIFLHYKNRLPTWEEATTLLTN